MGKRVSHFLSVFDQILFILAGNKKFQILPDLTMDSQLAALERQKKTP